MNDLVVRLHTALVDAMRQRAARLDQPVTVAEIYQDLIPYRMVRSFGFALNADYEFALLQLLAGEGKLARIEPPEVREELRSELLSPNPNVGMFRQYAACDVFVSGPGEAIDAKPNETEQKRTENPAARPNVPNDWLLNTKEDKSGGNGLDRSSAQPSAAAESKGLLKRAEAASQESKVAKTSASPAAPKPAVNKERAASGADTGAKPRAQHTTTTCASCARSLPAGRSARFCPYCGAEQIPQCPSCGEALDRSWGFCISCGSRVQ